MVLRTQKEVASLRSEMTMQIGALQNQLEEGKAERRIQNQMNQMQCQAEVKKELDKALPTAVEQGLRDLPFEMVCAYKYDWRKADSVVKYDQITLEFNNSNRPGGADGTMNIDT